LIKKTSYLYPNKIISAYKDNVAFILGPEAVQFAPERQDAPDFFNLKKIRTVLSLKAETHNFPTTVEPFNGAAAVNIILLQEKRKTVIINPDNPQIHSF